MRVDNVVVHLHPDDQLPLSGVIHTNCSRYSSISLPTRSRRSAPPRALGRSLTTQYDAAQHRITLAVATPPGIPPGAYRAHL